MFSSESKSDNANRLKAIIDTAVDGIITIDAKGYIESANPAVTKQFGYARDEMIGHNIKMLMPEPDKSRHDGYLEKYNQTGQGKIIGKGREVIGKRKDGSTFPFLLSISEIQLTDKKIYTGIIHDISELKEVKDALKKEMELNELKSRFVTMASHEFRTPLSAILSSASLIGKYNDTEDESKRQKHVNRIKSSVSNLTGILNDFLSLSKLEEGMVQISFQEFDIKQLSQEILDELNSVLKEGQKIIYKHEGLTDLVNSDKHIIKNVMINLLSNASKYSAENKVIEFSTTIKNGELKIDVKDEGIGIPEEDKVRLFGRFFRAQNATNVPGTGLGLNIVQKYVSLLDGTISFTSKLNEGSQFEITIPCS